MITSTDSKSMDINSEKLGVSVATLMDNAGRSVAKIIKERFSGKKIVFFCGKGNNGGDGFAAANYLNDEDITTVLIEPNIPFKTKETSEQYSILKCKKINMNDVTISEYDVIVDCALGTGLKGNLKEPYRSYVTRVNEYQGEVISVDVPSGLGTDLSVKPNMTITFHDVKEGMTTNNSGMIKTVDIGIPFEAYTNTGPGDMIRYLRPIKDSHKGCNGTLLIIGGGPYFGAPAMAAMAAMRTGTDLVVIATPTYSYSTVSSYSPVFIMHELKGDIIEPGHVKRLIELSEKSNAVLIGPGIGLDKLTSEATTDFISQCKTSMVIDADGLNALGKNYRFEDGTKAILTPHSREFLRIGGTIGNDLVSHVIKKANEMNATILLKGHTDIISDGVHVKYNKTGTSGMTSAGTGDVLSGIVAGLLAKGMSTYDAACLGAYISGRAGEIAFEQRSYGLIATDVIDNISSVLRDELR